MYTLNTRAPESQLVVLSGNREYHQGQVSSRLGWTQGLLQLGGAGACQTSPVLSLSPLSCLVSPETCCLAPSGVGLIY